MKILVTGGMGFIGSHLVDALVEQKHDVVSFDNLEHQVHQGKRPKYLNRRARYIIGDVRNKNKLKEVVKNAEIIFHQAAMVGVGQSMYEISKYIHSNNYGTANLLEILANEKHRVRKLIVASSMGIYGEGAYECKNCGKFYPEQRELSALEQRDWGVYCPACNKEAKPIPTSEDKPLFPTSIYAYSKKEQEDLSLLIGKTYGIPTVALRYFNIYGPRQSLSNPYTGVCAIFSSMIKNNHAPIVYEDGQQSRDFINVKDIVSANIFVMNNPKADYQAFNVGTGRPTTILEIASLLIRLYKKDFEPKVVDSYRKGDIRHCYADVSGLQKLSFKPKVDFERGMKELIEWARLIKAKDKVEFADSQLIKKGLRVV
ncbi:MAG: NAD-dependent epimerase/dehydratase family protein [Candidatus Omnitrophota bacterium]|nr:NAD-dependent epimerase/dehydratase family protein [Candidatus Omnitrophota bacterium]